MRSWIATPSVSQVFAFVYTRNMMNVACWIPYHFPSELKVYRFPLVISIKWIKQFNLNRPKYSRTSKFPPWLRTQQSHYLFFFNTDTQVFAVHIKDHYTGSATYCWSCESSNCTSWSLLFTTDTSCSISSTSLFLCSSVFWWSAVGEK